LSTIFSVHTTAHTATSPLSLHDALPISCLPRALHRPAHRYLLLACLASAIYDGSQIAYFLASDAGARLLAVRIGYLGAFMLLPVDRKSTRLNSSHVAISYAVFCLKKKTK